jgi:hypothetical protein
MIFDHCHKEFTTRQAKSYHQLHRCPMLKEKMDVVEETKDAFTCGHCFKTFSSISKKKRHEKEYCSVNMPVDITKETVEKLANSILTNVKNRNVVAVNRFTNTVASFINDLQEDKNKTLAEHTEKTLEATEKIAELFARMIVDELICKLNAFITNLIL